jgi:nitric oxide reductase subunit B
MKFQSQKIAYWFFASAMLLLVLQIVYGFIMGFARIGMDGLHEWIPFNTARAVHTNLLVVWLLLGFMGSAYFIIPEEADRELMWPKLAWLQLISFLVVGVVAVIGYHINWWEGRKFSRDPATARLPRRRQRARLPREHRHDDLERETLHHHRHRALLWPLAPPRCSTCRA